MVVVPPKKLAGPDGKECVGGIGVVRASGKLFERVLEATKLGGVRGWCCGGRKKRPGRSRT